MRASYSERLSSRQKTNYRLTSRDCFWEEDGFVDGNMLLLHGMESSVGCVKYWGPPYSIFFVNRFEIAHKKLAKFGWGVFAGLAHPPKVGYLYCILNWFFEKEWYSLALRKIKTNFWQCRTVVPHPIFHYHEDTLLAVLRVRITFMRIRIRLLTLLRIRMRVPDPDFYLMRIRILIFILCGTGSDVSPWCGAVSGS